MHIEVQKQSDTFNVTLVEGPDRLVLESDIRHKFLAREKAVLHSKKWKGCPVADVSEGGKTPDILVPAEP